MDEFVVDDHLMISCTRPSVRPKVHVTAVERERKTTERQREKSGGGGGKENRARKAEGMPAMRPTSPGGDFLQGWGNIVIVLVVLHLLALAFWVYKVMSEPTSRHIGRKTEADKE